MSRFVLDTDMLSLYQHGQPVVIQNVLTHLSSGPAISVITIEEQLSGWYALLRRAKNPTQQAAAYARLAATARSYTDWSILEFPELAILRFEQLRKMKLGVGGNDLRIAAIVLEQSAVLITRNSRDFSRVPGLSHADWSV